MDNEEALPVNGLVDNRRAAALLGVSVNTFKVWASRGKHGARGVQQNMPQPVATMHGNVYLAEEIIAFGEALRTRVERTPMTLSMPATMKRSLGSYFTPDDATELMVEWALRGDAEEWLEPSLGDGSFVRAARAYAEVRGWEGPNVTAVELDEATAASAVESGIVEPHRLRVEDFLAVSDIVPADVVIGNPPYVRIRALDSELAKNALEAAHKAMGIPMDPAGSAWLPFVAKATTHVRAGGRLAFVLPLDFTYVRYARPLWSFLSRNFGHLQVLRFKGRIFADILQNVLILFADDKGGTTEYVDFLALDGITDLRVSQLGGGQRLSIADIVQGERVFQRALLSPRSREAYEVLLGNAGRADDRIKFNIGYVAGHKAFFHPTGDDIANFSLPKRSLHPTVVNSRQLRAGGLRTSSYSAENYLWRPEAELEAGEDQYVAYGESENVHLGYKCRIRRPWYEVPGAKTPDVFLTTFSDRPKLYINDAQWLASNSVLCGTLREGEDATQFAASWYSALSLLSVELEVHALGGGVMIAVPKEADSVRLLDKAAVRTSDEEALDRALSSNQIDAAYAWGDESLQELVGRDGCDAIWEGIETLGRWRKSDH